VPTRVSDKIVRLVCNWYLCLVMYLLPECNLLFVRSCFLKYCNIAILSRWLSYLRVHCRSKICKLGIISIHNVNIALHSIWNLSEARLGVFGIRDTWQNNFSDEGHPRILRGRWSGREAEKTGETGAS